MIRINLLPHRQERRKAQRKHLAILAGMVAAIIVAILWGYDCVNHFKRLKNVGGMNKVTAAETAAGQSIRVGSTDEESGWRPTPT